MKDYSNNKKYQALLIKGKEKFWRYGLRRVTIEEVCQEASVSKMTFYKFFPNKTMLAKTIIRNMMEKVMDDYSALLVSDRSVEDKITRTIFMEVKTSEGISIEFINDIYNNNETELIDLLEHYKKEAKTMMYSLLVQAQEEGVIRKDVKIEFILYQIDKVFETLKNEELISQYSSFREYSLENINFLLYGLMPKKC
ncbi:TetR/AcrR family transcriptional regulator [Carboxylicivirga sp. RSCT41]|uniref:TetR/AcrR family transcriptional regulator n=1 Tax=Carboxylicivirga agarovorans TaxID=3417570 RepID=UPI003D3323F1